MMDVGPSAIFAPLLQSPHIDRISGELNLDLHG